MLVPETTAVAHEEIKLVVYGALKCDDSSDDKNRTRVALKKR